MEYTGQVDLREIEVDAPPVLASLTSHVSF
jgi:hypothetical protein